MRADLQTMREAHAVLNRAGMQMSHLRRNAFDAHAMKLDRRLSVEQREHPARVINMSLGGGGACDATTQNAINGTCGRGTVVVVAGNSNANAANSSPASGSGVVTAAAVNRSGRAPTTRTSARRWTWPHRAATCARPAPTACCRR